MRATYHTQIDAQTEAVENYLKMFSGDSQKNWSIWIPLAKLWYKSTQHHSKKLTYQLCSRHC